jgi:hypothetical protein
MELIIHSSIQTLKSSRLSRSDRMGHGNGGHSSSKASIQIQANGIRLEH